MPDIRVEWAADVFDVDEQYTTEDALQVACARAEEQMRDPGNRHAFECTMPNGDRFLVDYYDGDGPDRPIIKELGIPEENTHRAYTIKMELSEFIGHDVETVLETMAARCGHPLMTDIHYDVLSNEGDTLILGVTGDIKLSLEARFKEQLPHGKALAECEAAAFAPTEGFASLDEGHDCDPGCRGWDLFDSNRGWSIQRCDTCAQFDDDVAAQEYALNDPEQRAYLIQQIQHIDAEGPPDNSGLATAIVQFLERNHIEAEHLDGAMDQEKSRQRASINNGGLDEQVEYLLSCGWTEEDILTAAELDAGMPPRTLLLTCGGCKKKTSGRTAHYVNKDGTDQWYGECCWDERMR